MKHASKPVKVFIRALHPILIFSAITYWIFLATYMIIAVLDLKSAEYDWIRDLNGGTTNEWRLYGFCLFSIIMSFIFTFLSLYPFVIGFLVGLGELSHLWDCYTAFIAVLHMFFAFVFMYLDRAPLVGGCIGIAFLFGITAMSNFHKTEQLLKKKALRCRSGKQGQELGAGVENYNFDDLVLAV